MYTPKQGDYVVLNFTPQSGHEQAGRRPALIVSKEAFNRKTGSVIACPITNTNRGFRFHVPVDDASALTGYIMVEQVKSLDYRSRGLRYIKGAATETVDEVLALLDAVLF